MPPWSEVVDGTRNPKRKSVKVVCSSPESEGGGVRKIKGLDDLSCPSWRNRCDKYPDAILTGLSFLDNMEAKEVDTVRGLEISK